VNVRQGRAQSLCVMKPNKNMTPIKNRNVVRWVHIGIGAIIATYVYSPWVGLPVFQLAVQAVVLPAVIISGLWLWKGHLLRKAVSLLFIVSLPAFTTVSSETTTASLTVDVKGLTKKGILYVGLYKPDNQFAELSDSFKTVALTITTQTEIVATFPDLPLGDYAIAIYQDVNSNKKLDTNLFGYPKEPFGFSNNIKPKLSAPGFADCRITLNGSKRITINTLD
jgi:uncharacterized protein (DUF2141 family)